MYRGNALRRWVCSPALVGDTVRVMHESAVYAAAVPAGACVGRDHNGSLAARLAVCRDVMSATLIRMPPAGMLQAHRHRRNNFARLQPVRHTILSTGFA
jgi:hypothetical protein